MAVDKEVELGGDCARRNGRPLVFFGEKLFDRLNDPPVNQAGVGGVVRSGPQGVDKGAVAVVTGGGHAHAVLKVVSRLVVECVSGTKELHETLKAATLDLFAVEKEAKLGCGVGDLDETGVNPRDDLLRGDTREELGVRLEVHTGGNTLWQGVALGDVSADTAHVVGPFASKSLFGLGVAADDIELC